MHTELHPGPLTMVVHKALNGTLDLIIRGILITMLLGWMGWVSTTLLSIKDTRFTTADGLEMQQEISRVWQELASNKADHANTPPADYRLYVDSKFGQLSTEVNELHKVIERLETKIDKLR